MAFTAEQKRNAQTIIGVAKEMGLSNRDALIGLMTAFQESGLRNLRYGHLDSVGLFQQRAGWGSFTERTTPRIAAEKFFRTLGGISNRNELALWQVAQSVQVSAYPRAYAKWEDEARELMADFGGGLGGAPGAEELTTTKFQVPKLADQQTLEAEFGEPETGRMPQDVGEPREASISPVTQMLAAEDDLARAKVTEALTQEGVEQSGIEAQQGAAALGTPVGLGAATGGEEEIDFSQFEEPDRIEDLDPATSKMFEGFLTGEAASSGRASGVRSAALGLAKTFVGVPYVWGGTTPSGFDCSGLIQYVLKQMGVAAPRLAYQQANWGNQTSISNIKPGDLVFWGNSQRNQGNHIAFYLGNGQVLEAPRPGLSVRVRAISDSEGAIGVQIPY